MISFFSQISAFMTGSSKRSILLLLDDPGKENQRMRLHTEASTRCIDLVIFNPACKQKEKCCSVRLFFFLTVCCFSSSGNRFNFCSFYVYICICTSKNTSGSVLYLFYLEFFCTVTGKKMVCIPLVQWDLLS